MTLRMRPRFEYAILLSKEDVFERMERRIQEESVPWHVQLLNGQVEISPRNRDLHFWSPYLKVRLVEEPPGTTTMRGIFGPNINLWTFLLAIYAVCGLLGATGLLVALSQWQLDQNMTGLFLSAFCALVASLVWGAAQLGKRFAQEQMEGIYAFIVETYGDVHPGSEGE